MKYSKTLLLFLAVANFQCSATRSETTARLLVVDESATRTPCRVHLRGPDGKPVLPAELPNWKSHFCCDGDVTLRLAPGVYSYEIERGPEHQSLRGEWRVEPDGSSRRKMLIERIINMKALGWRSGDLHVHRPTRDAPLLLAAEDLDLAPVITWWNAENPWARSDPPTTTLVQTPDGRYFDTMAGEDERGGGALLYFGLKTPLPIAAAGREHPCSVAFLKLAKERSPTAWVDIEKPFWRDVPLWIASGMIDSIGIAHNHLWRTGGLHNEAWGRPRDTARWPGPQGNGRWTQEIYYNLLNCGLRIPPSAGSASGVLPNPVGYNRCYVNVGDSFSYDGWWEGLRAGRVFVTNGPLLLVTADGHLPGHVFADVKPKRRIEMRGRVVCRDPIERLEVVHDGRVVAALDGDARIGFDFTIPIEIERAGWFLVRAIVENPETFRFASTGPFYVETAQEKRRIDRRSAAFFLAWAQERRAELVDELTGDQRIEVLGHHDSAIEFWKSLADDAGAVRPQVEP